MKGLMSGLLIVLTLLLQYKLWFADGGLGDVRQLEKSIAAQEGENNKLEEQNRLLAAEVDDLRRGADAIEEQARNELGMIKKDETFYQII